MLKKLLLISAVAVFTLSCSLIDRITTPETITIVVTATPMPTEAAVETEAPTEPAAYEGRTRAITQPLSANLTELIEPVTSTLIRNDDYHVAEYCADVSVTDFAASAIFTSLPEFLDGGKFICVFLSRDWR